MKETIATDIETHTRELIDTEAASRKWTRSQMVRVILEEWEAKFGDRGLKEKQ